MITNSAFVLILWLTSNCGNCAAGRNAVAQYDGGLTTAVFGSGVACLAALDAVRKQSSGVINGTCSAQFK